MKKISTLLLLPLAFLTAAPFVYAATSAQIEAAGELFMIFSFPEGDSTAQFHSNEDSATYFKNIDSECIDLGGKAYKYQDTYAYIVGCVIDGTFIRPSGSKTSTTTANTGPPPASTPVTTDAKKTEAAKLYKEFMGDAAKDSSLAQQIDTHNTKLSTECPKLGSGYAVGSTFITGGYGYGCTLNGVLVRSPSTVTPGAKPTVQPPTSNTTPPPPVSTPGSGTSETQTPPTQSTGDSVQLINPLRFDSIEGFLIAVVDVMLTFAMPIVVIFMIITGFQMVMAQGNSGELTKARGRFKNVLIGTLIIFGSKLMLEVIQATIKSFTT